MPDMPISVLAFMDTSIVSGPARQLAAVTAELSKLGYSTTVLQVLPLDVPESDFTRYLVERGIQIRTVRTAGRFSLRFLKSVLEQVELANPDIIQTHSYRPAFSILLLRLMGKIKKPWIAFFHGHTTEDLKVRLYNLVDMVSLRLSDRIVVVAKSQIGRFARLGRAPVSHVPNAIIPLISKGTFSSPIKDFKGAKIGFAGRLSSEKAVSDLILGFALLLSDLPKVALLIAGDGPQREELVGLSHSLGLSQHVHFVGAVSDMRGFLSELDLFVLPSRTEGMPNVLLEAVSLNVPIVATDVGDVSEIVINRDIGLLVPAANPKELALAIRKTLEEGRTSPPSTSQAELAAAFSVQSRAKRLDSVYSSLRTLRCVERP